MYGCTNDNLPANETEPIRKHIIRPVKMARKLCCFGLLITLQAALAYADGSQPYFCLDNTSPSVAVDGHSAATIFKNEFPDNYTPPPTVICRLPAELGLFQADELDAFCRANVLFLSAPEILDEDNRRIGNIFAWSIDRESIGQLGSAGLCDTDNLVPSGGSPVLTETMSRGASACGDIFTQIWPPLPQPEVRLNGKWFDETNLEQYGGAFGDPELDNLDALEILGECDDEYYFSLDPVSAAAHGVGPADILQYSADAGAIVVVRTAAELGLLPDDDIDAMQVVLSPSPEDPIMVAISLSRGSPSLTEPGTGFTWSAADIFLVGDSNPYPGTNTPCDVPDNRCWLHAEYLSLLPTDNIDAFFGTVGDPGELLGIEYPGLVLGDVDNDGDVDLSDLAFLLSSYGTCAGEPGFTEEADIDHDGCVDLSDLAALLSNYGA